MRPYPKIDTLFIRDEKFRVTEALRRPVFGDIATWIVTEKIDGTNIRISYSRAAGKIEVGGRTDNAQIPADLVRHIYDTITPAAMDSLLLADSHPETRITLFGEGYGPGIQKGGGDYCANKSFIMFDALIECGTEGWWQDDQKVTEWAGKLGIARVPVVGEWSLGEIIHNVRRGIDSLAAQVRPRLAEGVVGRTREPLFDKRGQRLILKLKTSDFNGSE